MQLLNIPHTLAIAKKMKVFPFVTNLTKATYLIEITNVSATKRKPTLPFFWQEKLFVFLMRNSALDIEFYHLPYERTVAVGSYCEI
jgi:KUP system potassium uptake protein